MPTETTENTREQLQAKLDMALASVAAWPALVNELEAEKNKLTVLKSALLKALDAQGEKMEEQEGRIKALEAKLHEIRMICEAAKTNHRSVIEPVIKTVNQALGE